MLDVSIIIPVFNQATYTEKCLESILSLPESQPLEIIVVDNGSTDTTQSVLTKFASTSEILHIVSLQQNAGYAFANNFAAEKARGKYLVLLNNDTIVTQNWLPALLDAAETPGVGIVGPRLLFPNTNTINHAGYVYNRKIGVFYGRYIHESADLVAVNSKRELQALLGACLFLGRELFLDVGGISEFGLEDIDLCLKCGHKGLANIYNPKSTVFHHGSVTLSNSLEGTVPKTDTSEFSKRWPPETLKDDDLVLFKEDGYGFDLLPQLPFNVRINSLVAQSLEKAARGLTFVSAQDPKAAEEELRGALALWSYNEDAYCELVVLLLSQERTQEAKSISTQFLRYLPNSDKADYFTEILRLP